MYKEIDAHTIKQMLGLESDYSVDTLITYGGHPKTPTEELFNEQIFALFPEATAENSFTGFFQDIKSYIIGEHRLWFCVTYGGAMTSEIVHIASLLGAQKILHGGSCGALLEALKIGDIFLPESSAADESCTRMYQGNNEVIHSANTSLLSQIREKMSEPVHQGPMLSIQAMLAETREDIEDWATMRYQAVDLETATVFAVANHFNVPAAALLFISDNLVTEELVHQLPEEKRELKRRAKQTVLQTLIREAHL